MVLCSLLFQFSHDIGDEVVVAVCYLMVSLKLTIKFTSEKHCLAENWKRDAKQQGNWVLSDTHTFKNGRLLLLTQFKPE